MIYYKGNRNHLVVTVFTSSLLASLLIVNSSIVGQGLRASATSTGSVTPPANSMVLTQKIPGAWLVQIKGGGHGLMYQYPDKFSRIVLTFLET
jgi:hypothetical protein